MSITTFLPTAMTKLNALMCQADFDKIEDVYLEDGTMFLELSFKSKRTCTIDVWGRVTWNETGE
ncbi:hypothetical protein [Pseudoalteromonas phage J2-1_QLiu-2017]|nr:hypothetical protein [Pseudoalteromonas phage J2-1_QLiu-2017]